MSEPQTLYRIDPQRGISRFYWIDVQQDLFGEFVVVREWGRIGRAGRIKLEAFETDTAAQMVVERLSRRKMRRGYAPCFVPSDVCFSQ